MRRALIPLLCLAAAAITAGCNDQQQAGFNPDGGMGPVGDSDGGAPPTMVLCGAATTALPLPARADLLGHSGSGGGGPTVMLTRDLYEQFKSSCGACHIEASLGGLHVTADTFAMLVDKKALMRIKSDDATFFMPPQSAGGKPYSMRTPTDPIVQLYGLLSTWIDQGSPKDEFNVGGATGGGASPYVLSDWTAVGSPGTELEFAL